MSLSDLMNIGFFMVGVMVGIILYRSHRGSSSASLESSEKKHRSFKNEEG